MTDLSTKYLTLQLKNPLIAASSGITSNIANIRQLAEKGIGAVVLKSIFEEEITGEINHTIRHSHGNPYSETEDYITNYIKDYKLEDYLSLITKAKETTDIPIIASINCMTKGEWLSFAKKIEAAGADALEINLYVLTTNSSMKSAEYEQIYLDTVMAVKKTVNLPIAVKLGLHFTNLMGFSYYLYSYGASGLVLFNRFYEPDIDIENMTLSTQNIYSRPIEIRKSIRWMGLLCDKIKDLSLSASTGIHDSTAAIKLLLAGADTIQLCSLLYQKGLDEIPLLLKGIKEWMSRKKFKSVDDFRGKLSYHKLANPALYERTQFMKYFSSETAPTFD